METTNPKQKIKEENTAQFAQMRENLKTLRQSKNLSIEALSEISEIPRETLLAIETGEDFEIQHLFTLCRIYQLPPQKIFLPLIQ